MLTRTIRITWMPLIAFTLLAPTPEARANHALEMKANFEILNFQESKNYGPMTSEILDLFQEEIKESLGDEQVHFEGVGADFSIEITAVRKDALELKDRLKALVLAITAGKYKEAVVLRELQMRVSRNDGEEKSQRTRRPHDVRREKLAKGDKQPRENRREESELELEDKLDRDEDDNSVGPEGRRTMVIKFGGGEGEKGGQKRVALADVADYPLQTVLMVVSKITGLDVAIRPEAAFAPVNVSMSDVPLDQFLRAVCDSARVEMKEKDGYLVIGKGVE